MATISVIVPAAGCGARANLNGNKILAPVGGQSLLWWTLRAFDYPDAWPPGLELREVIIAARVEEFDLIQPLIDTLEAPFRRKIRLVEGGATRQASVANASRVAGGDLVLVHDAARPCVSPQLIARTVLAAQECGAAIAALPVSDTVKLAAPVNGAGQVGAVHIEGTLERSLVWLAQTPQVFRREVLRQAQEQAAREAFEGTDCASLVERLVDKDGARRYAVQLVPGEARNFKVTYAADVERAAALLGAPGGNEVAWTS